MESKKPACRSLVLDAGPLLSLSPLRGLAEHFLTVPQVLAELKDKNAREHFERLGLSAGVKIEVREPDAASLAQVIQFAKKTGDYSVLSHADLCVIALTLALDTQDKVERAKQAAETSAEESAPETNLLEVPGAQKSVDESIQETQDLESTLPIEGAAVSEVAELEEVIPEEDVEEPPASGSEDEVVDDGDGAELERLDVTLESLTSPQPDSQIPQDNTPLTTQPIQEDDGPLFDDPSDSDDGEGEWITPANVDIYKSRALELFPADDTSDPFTTVSGKKGKGRGRRKPQQGDANANGGPKEQIGVGCMTADFAMQNVLLQMDLSLVGIEGKRIEKVKTWVLRCHACFKICKDSSKKFCPSCGNPTLLRTSVTVKTPGSDPSAPAMQVHLKKNFVYRTRGTVFPIPAPKAGSSKTGTGEGLILREDQKEFVRARKHEDGRREREEKRLVQRSLAAAARGGESTGIKLGSWMDPDWVPEMLSVGIGGKGRRAPEGRAAMGADGMPVIGYGRKNPNERRRKK